MILQLNELRDKLAGCWTGKNVGGVNNLGANEPLVRCA